jgi:hypothetical protein
VHYKAEMGHGLVPHADVSCFIQKKHPTQGKRKYGFPKFPERSGASEPVTLGYTNKRSIGVCNL